MANDNGKKVPNVPALRFPGFSGEWTETTFGKTCYGFDYGLNTSAEEFNGREAYLRITDYSDEGNIHQLTTSPKSLDKTALIKEGDMFFARTGASVGKTCLFKSAPSIPTYFAGYLIRCHANPGYDPSFLFQVTQTKRYKEWVKTMSIRSGQPGINSKEYRSFEFSCPQYNEQKKISKFLDVIDSRIEVQKKTIEDIDKLMGQINDYFFNSLQRRVNTKKALSDLVDYHQPNKFMHKEKEYSNSGIPVLTANKSFILGYTNEKHGIFKETEAILLDDFTLDIKYVDFPFKVKSSALKILTPKAGANLKYVFCFLKSLHLQSSEHTRHYLSSVSSVEVPLPNIEMQKKVSELFSLLNKSKRQSNSILKQLQKEKISMLAKVFS